MSIIMKEITEYECCDKHIKKMGDIFECTVCGREWFQERYMDGAGSMDWRWESGKTYKEKYLELLEKVNSEKLVKKVTLIQCTGFFNPNKVLYWTLADGETLMDFRFTSQFEAEQWAEKHCYEVEK